MKKAVTKLTPILTLLILTVLSPLVVDLVNANPGPATQIAPVVNVSDIQVKAIIFKYEGGLWAKVNATYSMNTIYGYGSKFLTPNSGMGLMENPSQYVTVTVAYDMLDAYYPIPLNATKISFKMDGSDLNWTIRERGFFHLFDTNLPEVEWRINHVPQNFLITAYYEFPLQKTGDTYGYLGDYAFLFPLGARYDLKEIPYYSYNGYPWFGETTADFSIQTNAAFDNSASFSIDGFGALKQVTSSLSKENSVKKIEFTVSKADPSNYTTTNPYGIVTILDSKQEKIGQTAQTTYIEVAATATTLTLVGVCVSIYFKKYKQKTS